MAKKPGNPAPAPAARPIKGKPAAASAANPAHTDATVVKANAKADKEANAEALAAKAKADKEKVEAKAAADKAKADAKAKLDAEKAAAKAAKDAEKAAKAEADAAAEAERKIKRDGAEQVLALALTGLEAAQLKVKEAREALKALGGRIGTDGRLVPADLSHYTKDTENKTAGGNASIFSTADEHRADVGKQLLGKTTDEVYTIASKALGVPVAELRAKYEHLNPGMIRMNCGNRMVAALKKADEVEAE